MEDNFKPMRDVDKAIVFGGSFGKEHNDALVEYIIKLHREKFVGFLSLNPKEKGIRNAYWL